MMPEMSGYDVLEEIRRLETDRGIHGLSGVKVIMTTALDDHESIMDAFGAQCEGYLVKPIDRNKLYDQLASLGIEKPEMK